MERFEHLGHLSDSTIKNSALERRSFGREAVRVVIFDKDGQVALLYVGKHGIYKLPGGGIQGDEELLTALNREVSEETGYQLSDIEKLGIITEDREKGNMFQISHCYLAAGQYRNKPEFSSEETREEFSLFWARDLDEVIALVEGRDESKGYDNIYIRRRDKTILIAAKKYNEANPLFNRQHNR